MSKKSARNTARKIERERKKRNNRPAPAPASHPEITFPLDLDAAMREEYTHPFRYPRPDPTSAAPRIYHEIEWALGKVRSLLRLPKPTLTAVGKEWKTLIGNAFANGDCVATPAPYPTYSFRGKEHYYFFAVEPGTFTPLGAVLADDILFALSQDNPTLNKSDLAVATYITAELLTACATATEEAIRQSIRDGLLPEEAMEQVMAAVEDLLGGAKHLGRVLPSLYYGAEGQIGTEGYEPLPVIAERGWHLLLSTAAASPANIPTIAA